MNDYVSLIFGIFAVVLILCTVIELVLGGGFGGLVLRQSFPWLISGWCIWLAGFYVTRKFTKEEEY